MVGCGHVGSMAAALHRNAIRVVGIDQDLAAVEVLRKRRHFWPCTETPVTRSCWTPSNPSRRAPLS